MKSGWIGGDGRQEKRSRLKCEKGMDIEEEGKEEREGGREGGKL